MLIFRFFFQALDKMSTGSTNCCSQPGAHENFGHGGEGGAEKHPATVDEKTLRFVVHQFKAQGLGEVSQRGLSYTCLYAAVEGGSVRKFGWTS